MEETLQKIKAVLVRGPVFEAFTRDGKQWSVHKISTNGKIEEVTQIYHGDDSKSHAKRAAKKRAADTRFASWRVAPWPPKGR